MICHNLPPPFEEKLKKLDPEHGSFSTQYIARNKNSANAFRHSADKAALNRAFHADRVSTDTAWRKVKPFKKVDEAVVRYLSAAEARRLVRACPEDFGKLVQGALLTGCRYSELTRLKASNFNLDSGTLAIRLSKGKIRHVVLTDEGKQSFAEWTENLGAADRVFLRADGNHWGASHQKRPLDEAANWPVLNRL